MEVLRSKKGSDLVAFKGFKDRTQINTVNWRCYLQRLPTTLLPWYIRRVVWRKKYITTDRWRFKQSKIRRLPHCNCLLPENSIDEIWLSTARCRSEYGVFWMQAWKRFRFIWMRQFHAWRTCRRLRVCGPPSGGRWWPWKTLVGLSLLGLLAKIIV